MISKIIICQSFISNILSALMKKELATRFKEYYDKKEVYLMAATSADEETTQGWIADLKDKLQDRQ